MAPAQVISLMLSGAWSGQEPGLVNGISQRASRSQSKRRDQVLKWRVKEKPPPPGRLQGGRGHQLGLELDLGSHTSSVTKESTMSSKQVTCPLWASVLESTVQFTKYSDRCKGPSRPLLTRGSHRVNGTRAAMTAKWELRVQSLPGLRRPTFSAWLAPRDSKDLLRIRHSTLPPSGLIEGIFSGRWWRPKGNFNAEEVWNEDLCLHLIVAITVASIGWPTVPFCPGRRTFLSHRKPQSSDNLVQTGMIHRPTSLFSRLSRWPGHMKPNRWHYVVNRYND